MVKGLNSVARWAASAVMLISLFLAAFGTLYPVRYGSPHFAVWNRNGRLLLLEADYAGPPVAMAQAMSSVQGYYGSGWRGRLLSMRVDSPRWDDFVPRWPRVDTGSIRSTKTGGVVIWARHVDVELWTMVYGFGLLSIWLWRWQIASSWRRYQAERMPPGCCVVCRYDLRGNVSGVCSECGTAVHSE